MLHLTVRRNLVTRSLTTPIFAVALLWSADVSAQCSRPPHISLEAWNSLSADRQAAACTTVAPNQAERAERCSRPTFITIETWNTLTAAGQLVACRAAEMTEQSAATATPHVQPQRGSSAVAPTDSEVASLILNGRASAAGIEMAFGTPDEQQDDGSILKFESPEDSLVLYRGADNHYSVVPPWPVVEGDDPRTIEQGISDAIKTQDTRRAVALAQRCAQRAKGSQCRSSYRQLIALFEVPRSGSPPSITDLAARYTEYNTVALLPAERSVTLLQQQQQATKAALTTRLNAAVSVLTNRHFERNAREALSVAQKALAEGNVDQAWNAMSPYASSRAIADALPSAHESTKRLVEAESERASAAATVESLLSFAHWVAALPDALLPSAEREPFRTRATAQAKTVAFSKVPPQLNDGSPEAHRLLAPRVTELAPPPLVDDVRRLLPASSVSISVQWKPEPPCASVSTAALQSVRGSLPDVVRESPAAGMTLLVEAECSSEDQVGDREPIASAYISGHQQFTNPDFVAAQLALQQAQQRLSELKLKNALHPPVGAWAGAAAGLQEGLAANAVAAAQRRLGETPPFIQSPISAPYTAYKQATTRTAQVVLRMKLQDESTQYQDAREVTHVAAASGTELSGVMATDQKGLRNGEASLPSESMLFEQSISKDDGRTAVAVRDLIQAALLQRAISAPSSERVRRLGTLLLAFDVAPGAESLAPFREFKATLDQAPLATVLTMDFKNPVAPPRRDRTVERVASVAVRDRVSLVAESMKATLTVRHARGSGSGFVISSDGLMVTNAHVIEGANRLVAQTTEGDEYLLTVVATDSARDLALLKMAGWAGPFLELGDSENISAGEEVLALGSPLGLEGTATRGIVSAKRRIDGISVIQIDAAINPGSSGGPLLEAGGRVIGVTSWKISSQRTESIGFAVAATEVKRAFDALLRIR
jgi:S1-C subfamily serine protease